MKSSTTADKELAYPLVSSIVIVIATLLTITALASSVYFSEKRNQTFSDYIIPMRDLTGSLRRNDALMTHAAAMFAATGNAGWQAEYIAASSQMDKNLKAIESLAKDSDHSIKAAISELRLANNTLVQIEKNALALAGQKKSAQAVELFENNSYLTEKERYQKATEDLITLINTNIHTINKEELNNSYVVLTIAAVTIFIFLPVTWFMRIRRLKKWRILIEKSQQQVQEITESLDNAL